MRRVRTRVKAQDMKTGEFAYLDQLVRDGFFPNLWVLPKNYEPPQPTGQTLALPLEPIFNYSPPNVIDQTILPLIAQINPATGIALQPMIGFGTVGDVTKQIDHQVVGASGVGTVGAPVVSVVQMTPSATGIGTVGNVDHFAFASVTGVSGTGTADVSNVVVIVTGDTSVMVTGIQATGTVGNVLNGSGWGQGGGFGSNAWGES